MNKQDIWEFALNAARDAYNAGAITWHEITEYIHEMRLVRPKETS